METKITSLEISPQQESFLVRIGNTKIGSLWANTLHFLFGQKNHASDFSCFLFGEDNISFPFAVLITPIIAAITNIININQEPVLSDYWLTIMTFCVSLGFYTARKSNVYDSIDKFFTFSMVSAIFLLFPLMLEIPFEIYRGIQDTNKAQQALVSEMTNLVGHDIQIRFNEMDGTRYYLMHDGTGRSSDHKTLSWSLKGQSICVAEKCMDVSANGKVFYHSIKVGQITDISHEGTTKPWQVITELLN